MSPRWTDLVRADVAEALRNRSFHMTVGFFAVLGLGIGALYVRSAVGRVTGIQLLSILTLTTLPLVPLAALIGGYEAVAGPRDDGALKVVLGLPYSRTDVVVGTYLGRLVPVLAAVVTFVVAGHVVAVVAGRSVAAAEAAVVTAGTALLAAAFVGIAVGVSSATRSTTRAAALAFGFFLLSVALWGPGLVRALVFVASGLATPATRPEWANVVEVLNPLTAYRSVVAGLVPALSDAVFGGAPGPPGAFYRTPAFGAAVLVAWAVIAPLVGLWQFRRTDL